MLEGNMKPYRQEELGKTKNRHVRTVNIHLYDNINLFELFIISIQIIHAINIQTLAL